MNWKRKWLKAWVMFVSILLLAAVIDTDAHAREDRAVRPGNRSGLIQSGNHVFYPGDTLRIHVVFPRSLRAVWTGEADSYLLLRMPDGQLVLPPILLYSAAIADPPADPPVDPPTVASVRPEPFFTDMIPNRPRNLVTIDLDYDSLPVGSYQMALILTRPGGDPTVLTDWYNGFEGLVSVTRIIFANERGTVLEDQAGSGIVEGDMDGDGWPDDADEEADDGEEQVPPQTETGGDTTSNPDESVSVE